MPMSRCKHQSLVLLAPQDKRLRCRHCNLTIDEKELADGNCPECYEDSGMKRQDFERLEPENNGKIRYGCEKCGAVIMG